MISINITATVECSDCAIEMEVELTRLFSTSSNMWDDRNVETQLVKAGWEESGDSWICDSCVRCGEEVWDEDEEE
jgi:hypothetical protein